MFMTVENNFYFNWNGIMDEEWQKKKIGKYFMILLKLRVIEI